LWILLTVGRLSNVVRNVIEDLGECHDAIIVGICSTLQPFEKEVGEHTVSTPPFVLLSELVRVRCRHHQAAGRGEELRESTRDGVAATPSNRITVRRTGRMTRIGYHDYPL
jgi:hypothetical protein